jgi:UDP-N-acetylglucosamine--N-acetylmuramyl-(pentapeptide) pyrophosphoryl-undecaprenol N-acetylglucosamine transferase
VLIAARLLRIPTVLWEGNVVPGRSVRATARLAGAIAVTDSRTCAALSARRCYETGTPIRDPRSIDLEDARNRLGIPLGERVLLIFGGSQGVQRFNAAVTEALPLLVERSTVVHVTGDEAYAGALVAREALPAERRARYRPVPFLADEMTAALASADLVVGRAGASTLAECAAFALPLICVPYPHAAGHQRANAEAYAATGAARLVEDAAFDAAALLDAGRLLEDPAAHLAMSAAARAAARPGAADAVASLVEAAAEGRAWPAPGEIAALAAGTEAR